MLRSPPPLWRYLWERWLPLEPDLARAWWFALAHSRWSEASQWRDQFLAFVARDGMVTPDYVQAFLAEVATLPALLRVVSLLMQEQVLLRRDGHRITERLLAQADAQGAWKHLTQQEGL
jgi:hypothetical protein